MKGIAVNNMSSLSPRRTLIGIFGLGIASGLPFLLTLSTLSFWLAEAGLSKTTIGLFMLIGLPYSLKFLWAPTIDIIKPPLLHRWFGPRRGWALLSQVGLIISLVFLSQTAPQENIYLTALAAFLVSLAAASQDIVIDAYRIEVLSKHYLGMGAALESIGFRFGMLASGAGALYIAHLYSWQVAYLLMAAAISLGILTVLLMPEGPIYLKITHPKKQLFGQFKEAWQQIFFHPQFWLIMGFILFFKMADTVLNAMSAPFLIELGFSKVEFANITKVFGIILMIAGGLFGGAVIQKFSLTTSIITCLVLQTVATLMFMVQAMVGYDMNVLMVTVGIESFCSGLVSTVLIAYLSTFCIAPYNATHFTVLYSLNSLFRIATSALAGWLADQVSWSILFLGTALTIVPAAIILLRLEYQDYTQPSQIRKNSNVTP